MKRAMYILLLILLLYASRSFAQESCDLNNNGVWDISDLVRIMNLFYDGPPFENPVEDCDEDGLPLTVCDCYFFMRGIIRGYGGHGTYAESSSDTIDISDTALYPGQQITLPMYLKTELVIRGFQFFLHYDPELIEIIDFAPADSMNGFYPYQIFDGGFSVVCFVYPSEWIPGDQPFGYLTIYLHHRQNMPFQTTIDFSMDQDRALYTGIAIDSTVSDPPEPDVMFIRPVGDGCTVNIFNENHY